MFSKVGFVENYGLNFRNMTKEANPITLIFEEFIHDFCQRLLFADLHIRNDHTDYLNFKVCLHFWG